MSFDSEQSPYSKPPRPSLRPVAWLGLGLGGAVALAAAGFFLAAIAYSECLIDVPTGHMALLVRKTGLDLPGNTDEVAPSPNHKGIQKETLLEGRHFRNPYVWDWEVIRQTEIPSGKLGVLIRVEGDELPAGQLLATKETQKGIVPGVKLPGRYPINPYLYSVIEVDPVTIEAGFQGVVTNLSGPISKESNPLLVEKGERGVSKETLREGTHLVNPFEQRVNKVDCRSQRFNLAENKDFGFPSKDGFWVGMDAVIEFRVDPARVAEVYTLFNESAGGDDVSGEIISKIILPNARSFCRLEGSNTLGRDFISSRAEFQSRFQADLSEACSKSGVQIIQALITKVIPPDQIATPLQEREIAKQMEKQYQQEILQQESERRRRMQEETVKQKQSMVEAETEAVKVTTQAKREQEVALTKSNETLAVAKLRLEAAKDEAAAVELRGQGAAEVQAFQNQAEAAGWKASVKAFGGSGLEYARYVLLQKLGPAYRSMTINTADSPLMKIFESYNPPEAPAPSK